MNDFVKQTLKVNKSRVHKVKNSSGMNDYYLWLKKNNFFDIEEKLTQAQITKIIRAIHKILLEDLMRGGDVYLPCNMGRIELRKRRTNVNVIDGKIVDDLPIDWKRTLELWQEDEESRDNKVLVKSMVKEVFRVHYDKAAAKYANQWFMLFYPSRSLKLKLKQNIKEGKTDAFERY